MKKPETTKVFKQPLHNCSALSTLCSLMYPSNFVSNSCFVIFCANLADLKLDIEPTEECFCICDPIDKFLLVSFSCFDSFTSGTVAAAAGSTGASS